jgi:lysophospholipase L1-like esterase
MANTELYAPIYDTMYTPIRQGAITRRPQDTIARNNIFYTWAGYKWTAIDAGGSGSSQTLQQTLDLGNTATDQSVTLTGPFPYVWITGTASGAQGTFLNKDQVATPYLTLRNSLAYPGSIALKSYHMQGDSTLYLPKRSGTLPFSVSVNGGTPIVADSTGKIPISISAGAIDKPYYYGRRVVANMQILLKDSLGTLSEDTTSYTGGGSGIDSGAYRTFTGLPDSSGFILGRLNGLADTAHLVGGSDTDSTKIPLSGTIAGKPITGDLILGGPVAIRDQLNNNYIFIEPNQGIGLGSYDKTLAINDTDNGFLFSDVSPSSRGMVAAQDFSANYDPLTYVQKIYSDKNLDTLYRSGDSLRVYKKNGQHWSIYSPTSTGGSSGTVRPVVITTANGISGTVDTSGANSNVTLNPDATYWQTKAATKTTSDSLAAIIAANKTYIPLGSLINETFSGTLSNWTAAGTGAGSISAGKLAVSSAAGSLSFANYIKHSTYGITNLETETISFDITVGTLSGTFGGVGVGWQGLNPLQVGIDLSSSNSGKISYYYNNSATGAILGTSRLTVTAGDNLHVSIFYYKNKIVTIVKNITTGASITEPLNIPLNSPIQTFNCPSGQITIYALGGTHQVDNLIVTSNEVKYADWLFIGDSILKGYYSNSPENRWLQKLINQYEGNFVGYGAGNNKFEDNNVAEIIALAPSKIVIDEGTNNISGSAGTQTTTVFMSNLATLVSALQSAGYVLGSTLFITTVMPRAIDVSSYNSLIISTYGSSGAVIDQYLTMKAASGFTMNTSYTIDGLHPNVLGHQRKADNIAAVLNLKPKSNYRQDANYLTIDQREGYVAVGDGMYLSGSGANNTAIIGAGVGYSGGAYTAKSAAPSLFVQGGGFLGFYSDAGKTMGSTYTPTQRFAINTNNRVVVGTGVPANTALFEVQETAATAMKFGNRGYLTSLTGTSFSNDGYYNGTSWVATATSSSAIGLGISGTQQEVGIYVDSALTSSGTFTPTKRAAFQKRGLLLGDALASSDVIDPSAILDIRSTKGLLVPRLTETQRAAISSPSNGLLVYVNSTNKFKYYDSALAAWRTFIDSATNATNLSLKLNSADYIVRETPSGTVNSSNTVFTLANTPVTGKEMIFLNGLLQMLTDDYTISGATITFITAPFTGDKIRATYIK